MPRIFHVRLWDLPRLSKEVFGVLVHSQRCVGKWWKGLRVLPGLPLGFVRLWVPQLHNALASYHCLCLPEEMTIGPCVRASELYTHRLGSLWEWKGVGQL